MNPSGELSSSPPPPLPIALSRENQRDVPKTLPGERPHSGRILSPFEGIYYTKVGSTPAGLAYCLLLALSLFSFVAVLPRWNWRRLIPWLGLALLSVFQARAIPFFALVAGPVLAWNIGDWLVLRFDRERVAGESGRRLGRALTSLPILVLLVCAWPGWLQTPPFGPRHWSIDLPLSLERGAVAVRRWRREKMLAADTGGLHLSSDSLHAFAWFCPDEKRLLWTQDASAREWQRRMRADSIEYLVLYEPDRQRLFAALGGLLADPDRWPLLYQEGDLAIFGRRDPMQSGAGERFRGRQLDRNRLAFHPDENKKAPAEVPDRDAVEPRWWDAFWKTSPSSSLDRDEALLHLFHAEALQQTAPLHHLSRWESSQVAGLVAVAAGWTTPCHLCDARLRLTLFRPQLPASEAEAQRLSPLDRMTVILQKRFTLQYDDAPPALYYLAARAARRALATNPDDAQACLWLGESYLGLLHATRERAVRSEMPRLVQLRQAQASAALNRAVALRPDLARAHLSLGRLYQEMGYLDLALKHRQIHRRLSAHAGPPQGANSEEYRLQREREEEAIDRLAKEVDKREHESTIRAGGGTIRDLAFSAFKEGLAKRALDLLLESHLAAFGTEGMKLELELLLGVGRSRDVREWLRPEHETDLGGSSYHWILTRALAASGNYTRAEEECDETALALVQSPDNTESLRPREIMALRIGKLVLDEQSGGGGPSSDLRTPFSRIDFANRIRNLSNLMRQRAELTVLRGLLALEEGDTEAAEIAFRSALALWKDEAAAASGGGLDFSGRILAQTYLRWLSEPES